MLTANTSHFYTARKSTSFVQPLLRWGHGTCWQESVCFLRLFRLWRPQISELLFGHVTRAYSQVSSCCFRPPTVQHS